MSQRQILRRTNSLGNDAWLRLGDLNGKQIDNQLVGRSREDIENPGMLEVKLMRNPDYLSFAAQTLCDIDVFPEQAAVLQELWIRPFPMVIASRGFSKAIGLGETILTDTGWKENRHLQIGDRVFSRNGQLCNITGIFPQGMKQKYRVKLMDGRHIDCCGDHLWLILNQRKEKTLSTKQMYDEGTKYPPTKTGGAVYKFKIPNCSPINLPSQDLPLDPYILGCLLGDGGCGGSTPNIASNDQFIVDEFRNRLVGFTVKGGSYCSYNISDNNKINGRNRLTKTLEDLGLKVKSHYKFIPDFYKNASIEQRMELVRGLLDTDGSINTDGSIEFTNCCEQLIDDLVDVLRSLGITCKKAINDRSGQFHTLPQGTVVERKPYFRIYINTTLPVFKLPRKLERIKSNATNGERYVSITDITLLDEYEEMQCISVDSPDNTYVTKDYIVTHNSYTLALYATLRCALIPGTKIVGVGASFRQSRVIFEYMDAIWKNSPVLRSVCTQQSGPRTAVDRCSVIINDSVAIFIPLGNGEKIRGLRANVILADEYACLEKDSIVETERGFIRIQDFDGLNDRSLITGDEKHPLEKPVQFIKTPLCDVYEIKLKNGYVIRCSEIHKVRTKGGWKKPKDISSGDFVEMASHYPKLPSKDTIQPLSKKLAWLMGTLVSEGCITNERLISITTTDKATCEKLVNEYGFKFKIRDSYTDYRGWSCKQSYRLWKSDKKLRDKLFDLGLDYVTAHDKKVPSAILGSSEEIIRSFLSGLFDGDGSCFLYTDRKNENRIGLAYYSVSERLCRDIQFLMNRFGFDGSIHSRKSNISNNPQWLVRWNNRIAKMAAIWLDVPRFQETINNCSIPKKPTYITWDESRSKWKVSYKSNQRRFKTKYKAQDFLNKLMSKTQYRQVVSVTKLEEQQHLYDYHLPKTHSFYAEGFRQHNSIPVDVFETVVRGFGAVEQSPVQKMKHHARKKALQDAGDWGEQDQQYFDSISSGNQCVLTGTADYAFMHFAETWRQYYTFIKSNNNPDKPVQLPSGEIKTLREYFPDGVPDAFNSRDYSIIRIPYELIPKGFMDDRMVASAKANSNKGVYLREYGSCFPDDSDGFFRRTLLESCVASETKPIQLPSGNVWFDASLTGLPGKEYVYGVDPAAEKDNFTVVILEMHSDHTRIVHGWSTNITDFQKRRKAGLVSDNDYYGFCARKIRNLMKVFPTENIAMDAQGGGRAVLEAFHDPRKLEEGELYLWPTTRILDPNKKLDTDIEPGKHIIHMCQFANYDFTSMANHGTRKDFEDKVLLFPRFDPVTLEMAAFQDNRLVKNLDVDRLYDTLEDCILEIEQLKDELCTIVVTVTGTGVNSRDRWDTPETTTSEGRKARMRKDRYSALIMANFIARSIHRAPVGVEYTVIGGLAHQLVARKNRPDPTENYYSGPEWFTKSMQGAVRAVKKK